MKTRPGSTPPAGMPTLGYASVPAELVLDGPEVESQRLAVQSACERLGLRLVDFVCEHQPGPENGRGQPELLRALDRIEAAEASCLVVSDLERLSRRVSDLAAVLDRLEKSQTRLVVIDVGLDTATESGRLAVGGRPSGPPADAREPAVLAEADGSGAAAEPAAAEPAAAAEVSAPAGPAARPSPATSTQVRALGYASVPPDSNEGTAELEAQKQSIERRCRDLGFELIEVVREREPRAAKALERPGLSFLIERIAAGYASCVVVSGLERLSRSVAELGTIVQWLERNHVRLVAVDLALDTGSPGGHATAQALASVGGWERERLSERTRKGLAAARAKRHAAGGPAAPDGIALRKRIATMRADGMTLQAIADVLNEEGVPTMRGGAKWRPSSVQTAAGYKRRSGSKRATELPKIDGGLARRDLAGKPPAERS